MTPAGGNPLPFPPALLVPLFVVVFVLFWLAIAWIIAGFGWRKVEAVYPATSDAPPSARRIHFASMAFGGGLMSPNYGSCINGWLSGTGLWLRPILPFRAFHPMVFIPWTKVRSVESERVLLLERVRVTLDGDVPDLLFTGALGRAVLERR